MFLRLQKLLPKGLVFFMLYLGVLYGFAGDDDAIPNHAGDIIQNLGRVTYQLKRNTLALRLGGHVNLLRGSELAAAAELAGAVRLLIEAEVFYREHPEAEQEVLHAVLVQLRYLDQHTGAVFNPMEHWNRVATRLNALNEPSYSVLIPVLTNVYLPAIESAIEIEEAEAILTQAIQVLFDAFLLVGDQEDDDSELSEESDNSDSDEDSDTSGTEESSDEESSEDSDSDSSSESSDDATSDTESNDTDSDEDASSDSSGEYLSDTDSQYRSSSCRVLDCVYCNDAMGSLILGSIRLWKAPLVLK